MWGRWSSGGRSASNVVEVPLALVAGGRVIFVFGLPLDPLRLEVLDLAKEVPATEIPIEQLSRSVYCEVAMEARNTYRGL